MQHEDAAANSIAATTLRSFDQQKINHKSSHNGPWAS